MNVKIVPRPNPIDHTFRFYEPESTHVTLALPSFSSIPLSSYPSISVASSTPQVLPRLVENNQVLLDLMTSSSTFPTVCSLFIYQDQYRNNLLANCRVIVQPFISIKIKVKTGQFHQQQINVKVGENRNARVFTSNEAIAREETQKLIKLAAGTNSFMVNVRSFSKTNEKIRVHLVDIDQQELIEAWLLMVECEPPQITQMHKTVAIQG